MRNVLHPLIIAVALPLIAHTVSAQVLFSDNFNGISGPSGFPSTPSTGANFELGNAGRIGGTLTLPSGAVYINGYRTDGNEQLGNTGSFPGNIFDNNVPGDNLLLANLATDFINYDFSSVNSPLAISWIGNVKSPTSTDWLSFMLAPVTATTNAFINSGARAGILFRENGGTQTFDNGAGTTGATGAAPGNNTWQSYEIILSDTAGTGSAFAGNGSVMTYYANGIKLGSATLSQLNPGQGYLGFGSPNQLAGIDDIVVAQSVPVPWLPVLVQAISPANAAVAIGSNVVFTVAFSNSPPVNLQWQQIIGGVTNSVNTGVINATNNGVVTSTLTLNNVQLADSGAVYFVEAANATNSAAVVTTSPASLTVISPITWYALGTGNGAFSTDAVLGFAGSVANEVYGVNFGVGPIATANGYSFDDYQNAGNMSVAGTVVAASGYLNGVTTGDGNFDLILNNGITGTSTSKATLNNLVIGQAYTVLVLLDDSRTSGAGGPNFNVTDGLTSSPSQQFAFPNGTPAIGGFIMGTFTAHATTQPLTVLQNGSAEYIAVLLEKGTATSPVVAPTVTTDVRPLVSKVTPGASVTLSVTAAGTPPLYYQWSNQSGPIGGATTNSYLFNAVAGTNYYQVVVTNNAGSATSSVAQVISSTNIVSVYNFSFEDGSTGSGDFVLPVKWTAFNNTDFSGVGNNGYSPNNPLTPPADGNYYFQINKASGTAGIYQDVGPLLPNTTYTLTVATGLRSDFTPGNLGSPGIISLVNGINNTGTVLATTNGIPGTPNTWQDNTVTFITGPSVSGDLTVMLSVAGASTIQANFDNVRLTKAPAPAVVAPTLITDIHPIRSEVTTGSPWTLSITANGNPLSYQWYNQSGPISGATTNSYQFNAVAGTNYYHIIVTNSSGSVTSSIATVISATNIVTVNNFSFEDGTVAGSGPTSPQTIPSSWMDFNNNNFSGVANNSYSVVNPLAPPADGNDFFAINEGPTDPTGGIYQDVGPLLPNTTYTLTVAIGLRDDFGPGSANPSLGSPGIISLINGTDNTGTLLASTSGVPGTSDTWLDYAVTFTTGPSVSGHLTVELSAAGASTFQANFDNVRLTKAPSTVVVAPVLGAPQFVGGNLILTGTGGTPNAGYTWLTTTNLSAPTIWTTNTTGTLDGTGAFSNAIPVTATSPVKFFRLRLP